MANNEGENDSPLLFSEIQRFFEEKVKNGACPTCNENSWTAQYGRLAKDEDIVFSAFALPMGAPFDVQKSPPRGHTQTMLIGRTLMPLVCNNCGHVRSHDLAVIQAWLDQNPKEPDEVGSESVED